MSANVAVSEGCLTWMQIPRTSTTNVTPTRREFVAPRKQSMIGKAMRQWNSVGAIISPERGTASWPTESSPKRLVS